jgi:hypothetical protein
MVLSKRCSVWLLLFGRFVDVELTNRSVAAYEVRERRHPRLPIECHLHSLWCLLVKCDCVVGCVAGICSEGNCRLKAIVNDHCVMWAIGGFLKTLIPGRPSKLVRLFGSKPCMIVSIRIARKRHHMYLAHAGMVFWTKADTSDCEEPGRESLFERESLLLRDLRR